MSRKLSVQGRNSNVKGAQRRKKSRQENMTSVRQEPKMERQAIEQMPKVLKVFFPFWGRLLIEKRRTVLVIDEAKAFDKSKGKYVAGFVVREATSKARKDRELIDPNPDPQRRAKGEPMYLKGPERKPKGLVKPHNKKMDMPDELKKRYEKNNHKDKK